MAGRPVVRRRVLRGCVVGAVAVGVALAPGVANGAPVWSTPIAVETFNTSQAGIEAATADPRISMNAAGLTVIAWTRILNGVRVVATATRAPDASAFGPGGVVSPTGSSATDPQVVVNNAGVTLITWNRSDGGQQVVEYAARATPTAGFVSGSLGPGAGARPALDGNGNAVVVWTAAGTAGAQVARAAVRRDGFWQASTDLSAAGLIATAPRVVATSFGDVAAVWLSRPAQPAGASRVVQAARILLPGNGSWSAATAVSPAAEDAKEVEVGAAAQNGTALAVWTSGGGSPSRNRVRVGRSVIATGTWTTPLPVAAGGQVFTPAIDVAPDGRAVIAYRSGTTQAAVLAGVGTTTNPTFPLSPAGSGLSPAVAFRIGTGANRADATVIAGASGLDRRTQAGVRRPTGGWLNGVILSEGETPNGAETEHHLGRDAAGRVTAIWMTRDVWGFGVIQRLRVSTLREQALTCLGQEAHIVGNGLSDVITGTGQNDVIASRSGNDTVDGLAGNDRICLGNGDDSANGGSGIDQISGGAGIDEIRGDAGNDIITGGSGSDDLFGGSGIDQLSGGSGNDQMSGGTGADTGKGGTGSDFCANDIEVKISCP